GHRRSEHRVGAGEAESLVYVLAVDRTPQREQLQVRLVDHLEVGCSPVRRSLGHVAVPEVAEVARPLALGSEPVERCAVAKSLERWTRWPAALNPLAILRQNRDAVL